MSNDDSDDTSPLELEPWPRQHDLPPRWDGQPVEWGEWTEMPIICPPPRRERCEHCRSFAPQVMNLGRIWADPAATPNVVSIGRGRLKHSRHLVAILTAFRCTECSRDHVLDQSGNAWTLDQTDYTDTGSRDVAAGGLT